MTREIGVQHKTGWVLLMKLREAIAWRGEEMLLDAEVEIDGKYAGGHIRPENKAEDGIGRRLKKYQNMKRLCALAIRQRGLGRQTFTWIIRDEDSNATWAAVRKHVSREATVFADNHSKAHQTDDGTNTNEVESFFLRVPSLRRHPSSFSLKYFDWYMAELAWREDCRQVSNRGHTVQVLGKALSRPTSRYLCGHWQGNKPPDLIWGG